MMEREWSAILNRYGQEVSVRTGGAETAVRAFLQPVLELGCILLAAHQKIRLSTLISACATSMSSHTASGEKSSGSR